MTLFLFWDGRKRGGKIEPLHYRGQLYRITYHIKLLYRGRIAGIEPASSPWQREILPFDHIRILFVPDTHAYVHTYMIYHICVWIIFV